MLERLKRELRMYDGGAVKIMEVCGTHTAAIFSTGIRSIISPKISLISGPGCPVCVTSPAYIDRLIELAQQEQTCVLTFGDMLKVKGSRWSLTEAKANGAKVKMVYSPFAALHLAKMQPETKFIFAAVGFETTVPAYALVLEEALKDKVRNLKFLTACKQILPAMEYICANEKGIDAFLCPGHVSVLTGAEDYRALALKHQKPFVVAGFRGEHLLAAISEIMRQLKHQEFEVRNMYAEAVKPQGNAQAKALINQYFVTDNAYWRGIGEIKHSGLFLRDEYNEFDVGSHLQEGEYEMPNGCRCTDVILGRITPQECPLFKSTCSPLNPVGPCMVSPEGACGIWYKNGGVVR